jgi:hypothetical protein
MGITTTTQGRKVDWIITQIESNPMLLKESNILTASKKAQVYAIFNNENPKDYKY